MALCGTLIFDDECGSCSALAQIISARAPDIRQVSLYSAKAQMLLRPHFPQGWRPRPYLIVTDAQGARVLAGPALMWRVVWLLGPSGIGKAIKALSQKTRREHARGGWATDPADKMRAYQPASPADAAAFAGEPLLLPQAQPGLAFERVVQWYNLKGPFQTATYWALGEGKLVLEQVHRPSPLPDMTGASAEPVTLADGWEGHIHTAAGPEGPAVTLTLALSQARWLAVRAVGLDQEQVIAFARSCALSPAT